VLNQVEPKILSELFEFSEPPEVQQIQDDGQGAEALFAEGAGAGNARISEQALQVHVGTHVGHPGANVIKLFATILY
jgi:hypothetical protein